MPTRAQVLAKAASLRATFETAGARVVEPPVLQPARTLLDLYGEDIRARAYVTSDAMRGEQMLRPDFTVPVVQTHMTAIVADAVAPLGLRAATGDIGLIMAAVDGLHTTEDRKAALRRHIWRPKRFRALLDRYAGRVEIPLHRRALLAELAPFDNPPPLVGLRSLEEIGERVSRLHRDLSADPISNSEVTLIEALLDVRETVPFALEQLRDLAVDLPSIAQAVENMAQRIDALDRRGVDVEKLPFEASFGRASMEYYDGFVFEFTHPKRPDMPSVASGGRYDALTRHLGQGREIPAVGGVLRPGLMLELEHLK